MKIWIGALWATFGVLACVSSQGSETLATEEQEEIGACGANADAATGVMCTYTHLAANGSFATFASSTTFEKDGFDYVRCSWSIECLTEITPKSDSGAACLSVIGTGCNEGSLTGTLAQEHLLPPGTTADKVNAFCEGHSPAFDARRMFCTSLNHTTEQYEDLCCIARKKADKVETIPQ
jgi:hypothetical protein